MSGACLEKIQLLGGEFEICRFANSPRVWYFRQYIPESPSSKRIHIKRSLNTEERSQAERRAYEELRKLKTIEKEGGSVTAKSVATGMGIEVNPGRDRYQKVVDGETQDWFRLVLPAQVKVTDEGDDAGPLNGLQQYFEEAGDAA